MSANLFGLDGDEILQTDPCTVYESNEDYWADDWREEPDKVFEILEWTSKPVRHFVKASSVIDRVAEYDCEEYLDEDGRTSDLLEQAAKDPAVLAAFDVALDLLFAKVTYCWADEVVATHKVAFNPDDPGSPLYDGAPIRGKASS